MCKNNAFHLAPQVALNNKLWCSGCLFNVISLAYPFCYFIRKLVGFPSDKANLFIPQLLRILWNFPFSYFIFTNHLPRRNSISQQCSLSTKGTDSIHQGALKGQWQILLSCLENVMRTLTLSFSWGRNNFAPQRRLLSLDMPPPSSFLVLVNLGRQTYIPFYHL